MIFWRGYGIVPLVLTIFAAVVGAATRPAVTLIGLFIAAAITWFAGTSLNAPLRAAGRGDRLHSMFGVAMEYWSFAILAYAAFGVAMMMKLV